MEKDSVLQAEDDLPWTQPVWLEEASSWIREELMRLGLEVRGSIEQIHVRPWSTVLRVSTFSTNVYFKASSPALVHEPVLTQSLWRWRDDCIPEVLAADAQHGWMLYTDMGEWLRDQMQSIEGLRHWRKVLPLYAKLQIDMVKHVPELLNFEIMDRRLELLPEKFECLLGKTDHLLIDKPGGLTSKQYEQLCSLTPRFRDTCQALSAYGIPETLHHDDFHDGNIFISNGNYILADWGESCISHPFFSLMVTLRSVGHRLKLEENGGELALLRDIYLDSWMESASRQDLLEAFHLAYRVAMVNRALTWHRVVSQLAGSYREEYSEAVPGWLQDYLEAEIAATS